MKKLYFLLLLFPMQFSNAQNYADYAIKEQYERIWADITFSNRYASNGTWSGPADGNQLGDGMSMILASYLTMYRTTKDKAYLIKFINECLRAQSFRYDTQHPSDPTYPPKWSLEPDNNHLESLYQNGLILWPMAEFVLTMNNDMELFNTPLPSSDVIVLPSSFSSLSFATYGDFANWLSGRIVTTIDYINANFWNNTQGLLRNGNPIFSMNWQAAYATPLLLMGIAINNVDYRAKASLIGQLFKSSINVHEDNNCPVNLPDNCSSLPVFQIYQDNSYWWYDEALKKGNKNPLGCPGGAVWVHCTDYAKNIDDMSHAVTVLLFPRTDFTYYHSLFNITDMVRFRNTFTKRLFGINGFNFSVLGTNDPNLLNPDIIINTCKSQIFDCFRWSSLAYMPFYQFDDDAGETPNVYNIIMDFYSNNFSNVNNATSLTNSGFGDMGSGQPYYGLSEVVSAQWDKECPNLTLYNRDVVYDQDFFAKNELTIAPQEPDDFYAPGDEPYAEPKTFYDAGATNRFVIESGVTVNLVAGRRMVGKPGFHAKKGSHVHAYLDPSLYDCNYRLGNTSGSENDTTGRTIKSETGNDTAQTGNNAANVVASINIQETQNAKKQESDAQYDKPIEYSQNKTSSNQNGQRHIFLTPNPATEEIRIDGFLYGEQTGITITNAMGQEISKAQTQSNHCHVNVEKFSAGIYFVTIKTGGEIYHRRFVKN